MRLSSLLRCTINWCMRCHVLWRKIPRNVMSYDLNVGKQFSCNISTHNENSPYSPNSSYRLSHTSLDPSKLRIEMIQPLQLAKLLPSVQRLFCKNVGLLCIALRVGWRSRYFRHRGSFFCSANSAPLHGMHPWETVSENHHPVAGWNENNYLSLFWLRSNRWKDSIHWHETQPAALFETD